MQRSGHHLLAATAGLALGTLAGWPWPQAATAAALAAVTGGGPTSPDLDQYGPWRTGDKLLPDECLGRGGPMQHRGITHWWGLPAAVAAFGVPLTPGSARWAVWALLTGWASHLVGDFLFGRASARCHRGPGIPLAPWWGHVGLGLKVGGFTERAVAGVGLPALLLWQAWTLAAHAGTG